jgi:hypothetical protein
MATRSFPLPAPADARAELARPRVVRIAEVREGTVSVAIAGSGRAYGGAGHLPNLKVW